MSAQVLARIWRPKSFKDMVGQEHITRTLMNALRLERFHHAYLFCGTRGVGKTTIARILAKSFFCQQRKNSEPCNACSSCQAIDEGSYADLIEVDAASRTKVEDTRDLLSDAQFAPTEGKYKIYLIDEVHMLSGHSFNALLKTLEEPPPHIIFLFATTEPQKLPMTMISRCLRFNLKMITEPVIVVRLQEILKAEKISFEERATELLAHYARGSMRDALSLVDQAIAYCEKDILYDKVASMLGTAQLLTPEEAVTHLIHNHVDELLKATAVMEENGVDFSEFLDNLMTLLQDIAVLQLRDSNSQSEEKKSYVKDLSPEEVQLFYQIALLTKKELPWAPSPRRAVDMGLLRMLSMQPLFAGETLIPARAGAAGEGLSHEEEPMGVNKKQQIEMAEDGKGGQDEKDEKDESPKEELEPEITDSPPGSTDLLKEETPMEETQKTEKIEEAKKEEQPKPELKKGAKEAEMKAEKEEDKKEEQPRPEMKAEMKKEAKAEETKEEMKEENQTQEVREIERTEQSKDGKEAEKEEATEDLVMTEDEELPMETTQEEKKTKKEEEQLETEMKEEVKEEEETQEVGAIEGTEHSKDRKEARKEEATQGEGSLIEEAQKEEQVEQAQKVTEVGETGEIGEARQQSDIEEQVEATQKVTEVGETGEIGEARQQSDIEEQVEATQKVTEVGETGEVRQQRDIKEARGEETTEAEESPREETQEEEQASSSASKEATREDKPSSNQLEEAEKDYTQPYHWAQLVERLDLSGLQASLLSDTRLVHQQKGMWLLRIPAHVRVNLEDNSREAIERALTQRLRQSIKLDIEVGAVDDTPSMLRNEQRLQMVRQLSDSPLVKDIVQNYDGELDEDSVRQKDASP